MFNDFLKQMTLGRKITINGKMYLTLDTHNWRTSEGKKIEVLSGISINDAIRDYGTYYPVDVQYFVKVTND